MTKANNSTPATKNPATELARKIVEKIKDGKIIMGNAFDLKGDGITGEEFQSTNLGKTVLVSVSMTKTEGKTHPAYKLTYSDGGKINRSFAGAQARRAYRIITKVAVDKSIPKAELDSIESALDALK